MKIVVAKMDKRKRETGKNTVVFHNGVQVPAEKIANFKRRKVVRESDPASPSASTPGPVTYCTPRIDLETLIEVDQIAELDDEFNDLQFSAHGSSSQAQGVGLHVAGSNNTNLGAQNETGLFPVSAGFGSDKIESSLEPVAEKQNAAENEHKEKQARSLDSDFSTQPESVPIQETEDDENPREFVGPRVSEVNYPVIDEPNFVTDAPDTLLTELPIEEVNLSALSQAIYECFMEGWELNVTLSRLLSVLTYVQGLDPAHPDKWLLACPKLVPIATLAQNLIKSKQHSAAVSLYKGVIVRTWVLFNVNKCMKDRISLDDVPLCSPTILGHEKAILQIVIASYLKWQSLADIPSAATSNRIYSVIDCLRSIGNPKSSPLDEAVDRKLLSLKRTIRGPLGRSAYQFRSELRSCALDLADCYSQREEFEAAEALFILRLGIRAPGNVPYLTFAEQIYEQYRRRRYSCPYKPRVRPWSMVNWSPLPPSSLSLGEIDLLVTWFCQGAIFKRKEMFSSSTIFGSETDTGFTSSFLRPNLDCSRGTARRTPLPKRKEGLEVVDLDTETDTGFTTSSTRSYRYGVTMSDSDVPGIDLSRYLVE
ncbi:hypothetical protein NA56DRAFT_642488 [Hyaloscypha hepaticicola]|uniref:Uncharacterized protein n=1 Tax=Hyaloscypha hepaticicola TaxID=2082293 RepID=A0A2J6QGU8_9HELO|nr:hypothetical protein NA56DRAFT_642488 [Hyaloscypha hepaticicola]